MTGQRARAAELRRLHEAAELLVLVNVWDAASARTVASAPGCRAVATASWSIAAAHGVADGDLPPADMLAAVGRIAAAVDLPLTADLEDGYGDAGETVAAAIAAGAVGCNLEDGTGDPDAPLRSTVEHSARVAAARAAGEAAGVPLVVNARTDVFLAAAGPPADRLGAAIERGRAYRAAGADCIFVPGVADAAAIERLVGDMGAPVSVLATPQGPPLAELQRLGVARVSFGPGPMGVAMAALRRAAEALHAGGALPDDLAHRP
jgi:2-methylisocitrate lyase-like PEP mutase family enzyme